MKADFEPMKAPNDKIGISVDWETRLGDLNDWVYSEKLNGIRGEFDFARATVFSRTLIPIRSVEIQNWIWQIAQTKLGELNLVEGEFWSPELNLEEIKHFVMSKDVTSKSSVTKLKAAMRNDKWKFPGRSVEFMSTFPESLKLYVFDYYSETSNKQLRYNVLKSAFDFPKHDKVELIRHYKVPSISYLKTKYQNVIDKNGEGLMLIRLSSMYKTGRFTELQNKMFKMKDNGRFFNGVIKDVLEGTYVDPDAPKTINRLGRSVTSKRLEDRIPSGMAKGFLVKMEDGRTLTVSLKNTTNLKKEVLFNSRHDYVGLEITFIGMLPSKVGGMPSQSFIDMKKINIYG